MTEQAIPDPSDRDPGQTFREVAPFRDPIDKLRALTQRERLEDAIDVFSGKPTNVLELARAGDVLIKEIERLRKLQTHRPSVHLFDSIPLFGYELVTRERIRQITQERWTSEHDDQHTDHSLAIVAAIYAIAQLGDDLAVMRQLPATGEMHARWIPAWPNSWDQEWDKREDHDRMRCLTIAGALICAEIDRLQRQAEAYERTERAMNAASADPRSDL